MLVQLISYKTITISFIDPHNRKIDQWLKYLCVKLSISSIQYISAFKFNFIGKFTFNLYV